MFCSRIPTGPTADSWNGSMESNSDPRRHRLGCDPGRRRYDLRHRPSVRRMVGLSATLHSHSVHRQRPRRNDLLARFRQSGSADQPRRPRRPTKTDIVVDGQTTYYTVPTPRLPILIAFEAFVPSPILTALDAPLRVMVEWGYDRSTSRVRRSRCRCWTSATRSRTW